LFYLLLFYFFYINREDRVRQTARTHKQWEDFKNSNWKQRLENFNQRNEEYTILNASKTQTIPSLSNPPSPLVSSHNTTTTQTHTTNSSSTFATSPLPPLNHMSDNENDDDTIIVTPGICFLKSLLYFFLILFLFINKH